MYVIKSTLLETVVFVLNRAVLNHRRNINFLSFVKKTYQLRVRLVKISFLCVTSGPLSTLSLGNTHWGQTGTSPRSTSVRPLLMKRVGMFHGFWLDENTIQSEHSKAFILEAFQKENFEIIRYLKSVVCKHYFLTLKEMWRFNVQNPIRFSSKCLFFCDNVPFFVMSLFNNFASD